MTAFAICAAYCICDRCGQGLDSSSQRNAKLFLGRVSPTPPEAIQVATVEVGSVSRKQQLPAGRISPFIRAELLPWCRHPAESGMQKAWRAHSDEEASFARTKLVERGWMALETQAGHRVSQLRPYSGETGGGTSTKEMRWIGNRSMEAHGSQEHALRRGSVGREQSTAVRRIVAGVFLQWRHPVNHCEYADLEPGRALEKRPT